MLELFNSKYINNIKRFSFIIFHDYDHNRNLQKQLWCVQHLRVDVTTWNLKLNMGAIEWVEQDMKGGEGNKISEDVVLCLFNSQLQNILIVKIHCDL